MTDLATSSTSKFSPVQKTGIPEQIVGQVIELIRSRHIGPSEKLPSERELAARLNVSRPALREALRALSVVGLLEMRHGTGTFVSDLQPHSLLTKIGLIMSLSDHTFEQLFEARLVLEPAIAEMAASKVTQVQVAQMEECIAAIASNLDSDEAVLMHDAALHDLIAIAAGNTFLSESLNSLHLLISSSRRRTVATPGRAQRSLEELQALVKAIKNRNGVFARAAMQAHLSSVFESLHLDNGPTTSRHAHGE
jgi:GntR family transcriptional repressor for pyruvate dehydrogenase complex